MWIKWRKPSGRSFFGRGVVVLVLALLGGDAVTAAADQAYVTGLSMEIFESEADLVRVSRPGEGQTPNVSQRVERPAVDGPTAGYVENYVAHFCGELLIDEPGRYGFELTSDDGSRLLIGGKAIIDSNDVHPARPREGEVKLSAEAHAIDVWYFQGGGLQSLDLRWKRPGDDSFSEIPAEAFRCEAGVTRVVSPGPKRMAAAESLDVAGYQAPLKGVHPMWRLTSLEPQGPEGFKLTVAGMAYLPGGRLALSTFDPRNNGAIVGQPNGKLWLLGGVDGDSADITVTLIDDQLYNPLGVLYRDGELFVAQRDELTRYQDPAGDGTFADRSTLSDGWESDNYHHFTFGPIYKDGYLYVALSTSIGPGAQKILRGDSFGYAPNVVGRGSVVQIDPTAGKTEFITGGHRTPNGLFLGPDGELFVGDNQGAWQPANKINHVEPGGFYGHYNGNAKTDRFPCGAPPSRFADRPLTPPAVYLPHNEIANSPTDGVLIKDGPFAGQLLVSDVKYGGLRRISLEKVNGQYQGAAFRHSQGFNAGLNRLALTDDGTLYVGGIGERKSWSWNGTTAGLQRLDPTGETAFEFADITATQDGLRLEYTRPVPADQLGDVNSYSIQQWRYHPTAAYGGIKRDKESIDVAHVEIAEDRRSVRLIIPGLKAGRVVHVVHQPTSDDGETMWSPEGWYTMNQQPGHAPAPADAGVDVVAAMFRVLVFTKTAGFEHASIKDGVKALKGMAQRQAWDIVASGDAAMFTDEDLAMFDVVVFLSTTGDVLDESQQASFERFIQNGGGFVGIHAATDTEYDWPWYNQLVGGYFASHPKEQDAGLDVVVADHPSTAHLPKRWERRDEWYNFRDMNPGVTVLLNLDESSYEGGAMGADHPAAWSHEFDGGRAWYTAGGHTPESFVEKAFLQHLEAGIRWAAGEGN